MLPDKKSLIIEASEEGEKEARKDLEEDQLSITWAFEKIQKSISKKIVKSAKPFANEISEASEWLKLLESGDWTEPKQNESVNITKLHIVGLELPFVKGDSTITGIWSPQEILSVIRNKYARVKWDARFQDSKIMKFISTNSTISYNIQKGTWPVGIF
jgi:hypothetical protein